MNTNGITRKSASVTVKAHDAAGQYIDGIYQPASKTDYDRKMVAVPLTPNEIKYFYGEKYEERFTLDDRKFYDNVMDVDIDVTENDLIVHNGIEYEIVKIVDRQERGFRICYGKAPLKE